LQIDDSGLYGAAEQSIKLLRTRTDMHIDFRYQLHNVPLNPTEEIHLLQILREASQNAVNHSKGQHLRINLTELPDKQVELSIEDDGVGLSSHPEKLNHYGLAIIQERSRHLNAELIVKSAQDGVKGTHIAIRFEPRYLKDPKEQLDAHSLIPTSS
jgi:two-component system nitrate/nitrite sensor histidine kinase NarX